MGEGGSRTNIKLKCMNGAQLKSTQIPANSDRQFGPRHVCNFKKMNDTIEVIIEPRKEQLAVFKPKKR